ncbi:DcrB-related protein [Caulobacter sp. S45]|uniref:DcrB-related protein n=1 Tax=Caulobacter sp. S45 TaxID=1641861 RepID=UPI001577504D|nr:DcrB-related protein [Caulobacter sp. S45]
MPDETESTATYRLNEGDLALDVPATWRDETLHVLRLAAEGQATASLVITREVLPLGMEVTDYVSAELARLHTTLPDFVQIGRVPVRWPDVVADAVLTRWRSSEGLMDQITACRLAEGRNLLIFTATHPAPMAAAAYEALLSAISSFVPRSKPDGAPPAA